MKPLQLLIETHEPAMPLVQHWLAQGGHRVEILDPSPRRADVLVCLQVTTRSPMGAIAYETGGILIDQGWLRLLGSGHARLTRDLIQWNAGRSHGHLLIADDVVGGFFSLNGGALGEDLGRVYYWAPDTLKWEPLGLGYSDFVMWAASDKLAEFYKDLRWPCWESEVQQTTGDECFTFYPFLWTDQGSVVSSQRRLINVAEQFSFNADAQQRLDDA